MKEALRTNMKGALERAKAAAQANGDLDGVLLFDEAAKDPDATPRTDNETLREILKTRDQAKAGYRAAFDQDCARILAAAVAQLDRMKAEETKKGNIALAKEVSEYQKSVQETLDRIQKALDQLPPLLREAFTLFQVGGLSIREIAHETGASENLVKVRIHRAKQKLQVLLADLHQP